MQQPNFSIKLETVTPSMAAQMLGTSAGNRNVRKRAVHRYARDMIADKWALNGEAIKFDRAGRLIDGHHRLSAVIEAQRSVVLLVMRGVTDGAMLTLDTGVGRSFHDSQTVAGNEAPRGLGPVLRWWYRYDWRLMTERVPPSHQELAAILEAHPGTVESARLISGLRVVRLSCVPGVQGFVHSYAAERFDREMADSFMHDLNDGADLAKTSPIYCLRSRLIERQQHTRLDREVVLALTIKAWNAWMDGKKVEVLRWNNGGENPEPFPVFKGDEKRFEQARRIMKEKKTEQIKKAGEVHRFRQKAAG